ncbi:hypothetical protein YTPLAS18_01520 [Nitrospira sp.]|nr:hypothetical protein YTPLAS18_01520 [Nitrospira sp.]
MSSLTPPSTPLYRVTLFFGPETLDNDSDTVQAVFNVKKRSWKAGIQVAVHLSVMLVRQLRDQLDFRSWLESSWTAVPESDRSDLRTRAEEALTVELARVKLDQALERGLPQENYALAVDAGDTLLFDLVGRDEASIKARLRSALDLAVD